MAPRSPPNFSNLHTFLLLFYYLIILPVFLRNHTVPVLVSQHIAIFSINSINSISILSVLSLFLFLSLSLFLSYRRDSFESKTLSKTLLLASLILFSLFFLSFFLSFFFEDEDHLIFFSPFFLFPLRVPFISFIHFLRPFALLFFFTLLFILITIIISLPESLISSTLWSSDLPNSPQTSQPTIRSLNHSITQLIYQVPGFSLSFSPFSLPFLSSLSLFFSFFL